jgi:hypothetical protein
VYAAYRMTLFTERTIRLPSQRVLFADDRPPRP